MAGMGGGAAYIRLQVPKDDISANARHFGAIAAQNARQQKALNAQKKKDDDAARDKAYKATDVPDEAFKVKATKLENMDDINRDYAHSGVIYAQDLGRQAREAWDKGDRAKHYELIQAQKKIYNSFENDQNINDGVAKIVGEWYEKDRKGLIDPVDSEFPKIMDAFNNKDFVKEFDPENNYRTVAKFLLKNEDGTESVKRIPVADLINENYRPYEKVDISGENGLIDNLLSTLGKRKYDEKEKNYIITKQVWDEKRQKALNSMLEEVVNDDRKMASILRQATTDEEGNAILKKGKEFGQEFTDKDKEIVKNHLTNLVLGAYSEEEKMKPDSTDIKEETLAQRKKEHRDKMSQKDKDRELDWWKAKNPNSKNNVKVGSGQEVDKEKIYKLYEIAKKVSETDLNDDAVQKTLDETGLGFLITTDWQLGKGVNNLVGGDYNQFDLGNVKDIDQKDVFKIVKGLGKQVGINLKETDIRDIILDYDGGSTEENTDKSGSGDDPLGIL